MDQPQAKAIWEEILQEAKNLAADRLPGEMTIKEVMQQTGLGRNQARTFLDMQVQTGLLKKRVAYLRDVGARACLYSPVLPSDTSQKQTASPQKIQ